MLLIWLQSFLFIPTVPVYYFCVSSVTAQGCSSQLFGLNSEHHASHYPSQVNQEIAGKE